VATYSAILWGVFSGGIIILLRTLFVAAMSDVGRRISSTMIGITVGITVPGNYGASLLNALNGCL
jgi:hypothetical protein